MNMEKVAELYKALGDKTRLEILQMLSKQEMCVCEVIDRLDKSQPAISHHLKILRQAGLIVGVKEGKWIYYSLNDQVFDNIFEDVQAEIICNYARPIKEILKNAGPSQIRRDSNLCEQLSKKRKQ